MAYLSQDDLSDAFRESEQHMKLLFDPFEEFERLARNKPHPSIDKAHPKTTDGTLASVIKKTPRRVIQQVPTALVESDSNDWLSVFASFVYSDVILPNANMQYDLIQKCWNVVEKGLTYGSQPAYVQFVNYGDYIGTDFILPYIKDVFLEKGKLSDKDSNYIMMRAWYQPRDIQAIIDKETRLAKSAKERGDKYESEWDLKALAEIKDAVSAKNEDAQTPNDKAKDTQAGGVEIIHFFQKGEGEKFYSWHRQTDTIVRTKVNPDPRGCMPIHYFYAETDGSNPLGRGYPELVGSLQNLLDSDVQMYQYNRALMLNPPLVKRGSFSSSMIKFVPNALIDMGSDPNASLDTLKIDSTAISGFANNYGLMKSQLINLLSSPDTSISSEVGNPGFSKTPAGIQAQQSSMSVDDNYIRKQFEAWFEDTSETMVNLYFAERSGLQEVKVDKKTAEKLVKIDPGLVSPEQKVRIDFDTATEALKVRVDASTSAIKDDSEERDRLLNLLEINAKFGLADKGLIDERELVDRVVGKLGIEDPEKVVVDEEEYKQMQAEKMMMQQQEQAAMAQMAQAAQQVAQPQAPAEAQPQAPQQALDQEDAAFAQELQNFGFNEEQIVQAMQMLQQGISNEEILAALGVA